MIIYEALAIAFLVIISFFTGWLLAHINFYYILQTNKFKKYFFNLYKQNTHKVKDKEKK